MGKGRNTLATVAAALLALALAAPLAGCGTPTVPEDHYYRLTVAAPAPAARPPLPGVVAVERFAADGLLSGRPLIHTRRSTPGELREYHYHFWVEPPGVMVRDALVTYLREGRLAGRAVTPEMRVEPAVVVRGRLRRMEQILGPAPAVAVEIDVLVQNVAEDRVLALESIRVEKPAADDSVSAAVVAFGAAFEEAFARLARAVGGA